MAIASSSSRTRSRFQHVEASPLTAVLILIGVTLVIRLAFAMATGLGVDETYTVATSHTLVLSTYDHPPMAWWFAWAASHTLGTSPIAVRLPFVLLFAFSTWQMFRLTSFLFNDEAGFLSAFILNCAPVLGVTSATWVLPDGPLIAAMLSCGLCLARVLFDPKASPYLWLGAGVFGGLALLSKYHGIFLFAGTFLFLVTSTRYRRWLMTPWPYAGALIALAIFSPVLVWNAEHSWASFAFQGERGEGVHLHLWRPFVVLAGNALYLLPWIWAGLMVSAGRALWRWKIDARRWLLFCLGIGPVAVFTAVSLWSGGKVLFHWAAPGYLMWIPMLGADLNEGLLARRALTRAERTSAGVTLGVVLVVGIVALSPWPNWLARPPFNISYPLAQMVRWDSVTDALKERGLLHRPGLFVAGMNWHNTGKLDYALQGALPVTCLCTDPREYGVIAPVAKFTGKDAIAIVERRRAEKMSSYLERRFAHVERGKDIVLRYQGTPIRDLAVFRCTRLLPEKG